MRKFTKYPSSYVRASYPQSYISADIATQNSYRGFEVVVKDTEFKKQKLAVEIAMACGTVDYNFISGYLYLTGEDVDDLDYIKDTFDYLGIDYTVKEFYV